jgi:hypothetical protein
VGLGGLAIALVMIGLVILVGELGPAMLGAIMLKGLRVLRVSGSGA